MLWEQVYKMGKVLQQFPLRSHHTHNVNLENGLALAHDGCFWGEKEKLQVKALSKMLLIEVLS